MNVKDFLDEVAYIGYSEIEGDMSNKVYYSKFDASYMTRVGMEHEDTILKILADREITEELTHGVGFSPKENKWYGWSHRAMCGFTIGSTCEKGDAHYRASNIEEEMEKAQRFWHDEEYHKRTFAKLKKDGSIWVTWEYNNQPPNKKCHDKISGTKWYYDPNNFGKGEWTAKTMEDAKQMAIDFNEGVS